MKIGHVFCVVFGAQEPGKGVGTNRLDLGGMMMLC